MPGKKPLFDEKMKRYVYVCMLNKQRFLYSRGRYYSEYFTQSSDSYEGWEKDLVVHKSIKIEKGRYIVPITYWKGSAQLIVFVSEENGSLYITKVADPLSPF